MNKANSAKPTKKSSADPARAASVLTHAEDIDRATQPADDPGKTPATAGSDLFGMILPDPANPFFTELLSCFESIVSRENHDLLFASTHFDPRQVDTCIRRMVGRKVDGIVFPASEMLSAHESLKLYDVPFVTLDRGEVSERVSDVSVDFDSAMIDAVRYLHKMGHNRIAFIGGFPGPMVSQARVRAFKAAMQLAALDLPEAYVQEGDFRAEGGAAAMSRLLALKTRPTAVVSVNDLTALGALQLLQERGISVPHQISILGFDDIGLSTLVSPRLTTLRLSKSHMAQTMYDALNHLRDERVKRGSLCKVRAELVVRDSVARAKSAHKRAQRR